MTKSAFIVIAAIVVNTGCGVPGRPRPGSEVLPPTKMLNFSTLYATNCAGCHGQNGRGGPAVGIGDPVYLAIADDSAVRRVVENGVPGTAMSAFAQSAGGMLTSEQVNAIVSGMRAHWAKPDVLQGVHPPSYAAEQSGDPNHGANVYSTYCSSCHGEDGNGGRHASSIVDPSYLSLVSDQHLRTTVIVGRPELGAPDWRGDVPGQPMSDQDVSDVVAWLASKRPLYTTKSLSNGTAVMAGGQ
jgi:mono/diheme cytochrome c family protein